MPAIWKALEAVGLDTTEACGDCPRVILGSPVAGIAADEIIDPLGPIEAIKARWIGDPEFSNLPRKFKTAVSGRGGNDVVHELNDISFVGVEHPELGPGFDLWVGGGLSTNPRLAERLGVFVAADEVPDVWAGVVSVFRDFGYRRLRHRARLKFLVADWGVEKFREVLEKDYLGPGPARRSGARAVGRPRRRRRRARAEGRPVLRRGGADGRPGLRRAAAADRRRRRGPRLAAGADHAAPEAARPRRRRRPRSSR